MGCSDEAVQAGCPDAALGCLGKVKCQTKLLMDLLEVRYTVETCRVDADLSDSIAIEGRDSL